MYEAILLFWLLFAIYLTFHYPCVLLNHIERYILQKKTFKSNRNSITIFSFAFCAILSLIMRFLL